MAAVRPHRLLWSPHPNHNQFLIGSTELRLFEWVPEVGPAVFSATTKWVLPRPPGDDKDGKPHATPVAVNTDVALMKCFTWSPDPNYMDLTAVGLTTGKTLLIRMHRSEPWVFDDRADEYAPDTPRQVSIAQNQRTYPSFSARHSRACNVVAFSKGAPNLLAVGLDKVRNDYCLMIWDTEQAMTQQSRGSDSSYAPSGSITTADRRQTARGQGTTSRFSRPAEIAESYFGADSRLSMNPLSLTDGMGTAKALRASAYEDSASSGPLCQYGSSEVITSCAWFTNEPKSLVAGMGLKYLRVYDTREDQNSPASMIISTKAVHGICMDPFNNYRMASCSDDGIIKIWDIRNPSHSLLSFYTGPKAVSPSSATLVRIQFSPKRSGLLASLTKDATCIKVWDIQEGTARQTTSTRTLPRVDTSLSDIGASNISTNSNGFLSKSMDKDGMSAVAAAVAAAAGGSLGRDAGSEENEVGVPILWKSRRTRPSSKPIQSFAWIPTLVSSSTSGLISINKEYLIETTLLKETSHVAWEPRGSLVVSGGNNISCFPSQRSMAVTAPEPAPQHGFSQVQKRNSKVMNLHLPANRKAGGTTGTTDKVHPFSTSSAAANTTPHSITTGQGLGATTQVSSLAVSSSGVTNTAGLGELTRRGSIGTLLATNWHFGGGTISATPQVDEILEHDISVVMRENAIRGYSMDAMGNSALVSPGPLKDFWAWMVRAEKIAQSDGARIGKFDFSFQGVWTVLLGTGVSRRSTPGSTPRVMSPLPRSSSEAGSQLTKQADEIPIVPTLKLAQHDKLKLMSIVVAGFSKNHTSITGTTLSGIGSGQSEKASSVAWREQCRAHAREQESPYIRAIFSFIASGDWRDVLEEESLSLADRIGVALRFLGDDELMVYIQTLAENMIQEGRIDGILLTGLTEQGLDLLSNYVNRTGDVQTVALAASVAVPRYFKDSRVDEWVEHYRELLDRWQLYYTRARFDIARGRYLQPNTSAAADMAPTQIYVRCNFCNQSVARNLLIPGVRGRDGRRVVVVPSGSGGPPTSGGGAGSSGASGGPVGHTHDKMMGIPGAGAPGGVAGGAGGTGAGAGAAGAPATAFASMCHLFVTSWHASRWSSCAWCMVKSRNQGEWGETNKFRFVVYLVPDLSSWRSRNAHGRVV
ncbi:hypothetical protein BGW41_005933 [Actinomortierella wolfii]|nr:hypothetical protein BGW41_005933 [Actinomortierella wolfii]